MTSESTVDVRPYRRLSIEQLEQIRHIDPKFYLHLLLNRTKVVLGSSTSVRHLWQRSLEKWLEDHATGMYYLEDEDQMSRQKGIVLWMEQSVDVVALKMFIQGKDVGLGYRDLYDRT